MCIQGCNHFASVVGSVRACTGMEVAASSKFGFAKVNGQTKKTEGYHSDLPVLDFVPAHAFHALPYTMHMHHLQFL